MAALQPANIIDAPATQTVLFGSQKVTFTSGYVLIVEDFTFDKPARSLHWTDEQGRPRKATYISDWATGSMTVQLGSVATHISQGERCSIKDSNNQVIQLIVIGQGIRYSNAEVIKQQLTVVEQINS